MGPISIAEVCLKLTNKIRKIYDQKQQEKRLFQHIDILINLVIKNEFDYTLLDNKVY